MRPLPLAVAVLAAAVCGCATQRAAITEQPAPANAATLDPAWAALDPDHTGYLTVDELRRQHAVALLQDLPNADPDHDDRVSWSEWNAWWPRMIISPPAPSMARLNERAGPD